MASKKRATNEEVKGMLFEGNFGKQTEEPYASLPVSDPVTITQMTLTLSDIKPYDRNPRKERNAEYNEIKASILKTKGLNNDLSITRRPGDDLYMVNAGGNTRLKILNELYQETGDEAFNVLHCLFKPWISELHTLTAHLIENTLRAEMVLIDKAYAVAEMKKELEIERGAELSRNEFAKLSTENGFRISKSLITRLNYAIELDQMIPQLLRSGLGGGKIDEIKKLHQAYRDYCSDKTDQLELIFADVLSQHDDEDFELKEIRRDLDDQLETIIDIRYNLIYMEIQAILFKQPVEHELEPLPHPSSQQSQVTPASSSHLPLSEQTAQSQEAVTSKNNTTAIPAQDTQQTNQNEPPSPVSDAGNIIPDNSDSVLPEETKTETEKSENDKNHFRDRIYQLACKIAEPYELEPIILPVEQGLGFIVECLDYPFDLNDKNVTRKIKVQYLAWWWLFSMSEQNTGIPSHFYPWMHTELFNLCQQSTATQNAFQDRVCIAPELSLFIPSFVQSNEQMSDITFTDCFKLMETIRKMKRKYPDEEIWPNKKIDPQTAEKQ